MGNFSFDRKKIGKRVFIAFCAAVAIFFSADAVRTKLYSLPPLFCVKVYEYGDGLSADYYGAGYKIRRDHSIIDGSEKYTVTLWFLPDSISL